jgi:hypothetical protein
LPDVCRSRFSRFRCLVKSASPKSLHEHIARLALRHSQANPSAAFGQNQHRPAEPQDKKPGEVALA